MVSLKKMFHQRSGKFIFFDSETTDLNPGEIAQLSYVITDQTLTVLNAKNFYFAVEKISPGASRVNGLTTEICLELSGGKRFDDYLLEIHSDFHQQHLVAHNIKFDMRFMESEFSKRGIRFFNNNRYCTMNYFKPICGICTANGSFKNPKLSEVVDYYQIAEEAIRRFAVESFGDFDTKFHDSRFDVAALYLICKSATEAGHIEQAIG